MNQKSSSSKNLIDSFNKEEQRRQIASKKKKRRNIAKYYSADRASSEKNSLLYEKLPGEVIMINYQNSAQEPVYPNPHPLKRERGSAPTLEMDPGSNRVF